MGHFVEEPNQLFRQVRYNTKSTAEIRESMQRKVKATNTLILEREERVARLREEHRISAERLADLVIQFQKHDGERFVSYNQQGGSRGEEIVVPAGVIANIVREKEMITSERTQIRKMELILRNIRDTEEYVDLKTGEVKTRPTLHQLTDAELEYLGF